jgi:uncharacterized membrane protein YcjF (UPF0283 family)
VLLVAQIASVYRLFHNIHPWAGFGAAAVFVGLMLWLIARPLWTLLRVPRSVDPPLLPAIEDRNREHHRACISYLGRYLDMLQRNPLLSSERTRVDSARDGLRRLRGRLEEADQPAQLVELGTSIREFEEEHILPLLAPLDQKADALIRREAVAIGTLTALSHMGTVDAFLVLWRDVNLVASIARIYYGRPGLRGSWHVLRDVSSAILLSTVLEQLSQMGTRLVHKLGEGGRTIPLVGALVGPLLDGTVNGLMTMKVGYLAKARCRSFQAWDPKTQQTMVQRSFQRVSESATGLLQELQAALGQTGSILRSGAGLGKSAAQGVQTKTIEMLSSLRRTVLGDSD